MRDACDIVMQLAVMASRSTSTKRYTYTPVHLLRQPPPPLLGAREALPVFLSFAEFLAATPAHTTQRSPTRLRADELWPAARVVPPPAFFSSLPDPGVAGAATALRYLAEAASLPNGETATTAIRTTTTAPTSRRRKRPRAEGAATPVKPTTVMRDFVVDRENAPALPLALPFPVPRANAGAGDAPVVNVNAKPPAVKPLEKMEYRELKNLFPVVIGTATTSNNKGWIYKRLKDHFDLHGDPRVEGGVKSKVLKTKQRKSKKTSQNPQTQKPLEDAKTNEASFSRVA